MLAANSNEQLSTRPGSAVNESHKTKFLLSSVVTTTILRTLHFVLLAIITIFLFNIYLQCHIDMTESISFINWYFYYSFGSEKLSSLNIIILFIFIFIKD